MNNSLMPAAITALVVLAALSHSEAGLVTETVTYTPGLGIPDNSIVGVADTHSVTSQIAQITNLQVFLNVAGNPANGDAFNGDFYAYLSHGSGFSVLLNRTGRSTSNTFGYSDSGFNVTFSDSLPNPDIHIYQLTVNPGGGALTGVWSTDGRDINPLISLATTPRTALLTSFNGLDASGDWTLFVSDVSAVGTGRLVSWGLEITGNTPIPEPTNMLFGVCITAMLARERRRVR